MLWLQYILYVHPWSAVTCSENELHVCLIVDGAVKEHQYPTVADCNIMYCIINIHQMRLWLPSKCQKKCWCYTAWCCWAIVPGYDTSWLYTYMLSLRKHGYHRTITSLCSVFWCSAWTYTQLDFLLYGNQTALVIIEFN